MTPPTWRVRFVRWLVAVTVLTVAYQAYALLVVPVIEPSPEVRQSQGPVEPPLAADTHPELAELFPEEAWERGRPMVLTTQWGKLLFREYRTSDDGRLELVPCTIVFYAPARGEPESGGRRAIVLQAPDKAVLSFSGPLNLARAELAKLKGARLEGEVKIWSRESRPGADDALSLVTRNVQILPEQIWTAHEVTFQYGSSHGRGRDLSIALSPSGASGGQGSLVRNLAALELAHIDQLTFNIPATDGLDSLVPDSGGGAQQPAAAEVSAAPAGTDEVHVTCRGPFRFDFEQSFASLDDHVDVVRHNASGESDQLNCDRLLIYFQVPPDAAAGAEPGGGGPPADRPAVSQKMAVRRIEARGFPASLRVPSMAASARGQQLSYDFQTRRILLVDDQNARLTYRAHQAEAPRLEYELHAEPKRLGHLWASGPGIYQGQFGDGPERRLTARWRGVLELQPQEGLHVLSIVEGADITWSEMGSFAANELYVWLAEVPVPEPAGSPPAPAGPAAQAAAGVELAPAQLEATPAAASPPPVVPPPTRMEIRPVKMLAQGNVSADARQFQGQTPRLEIWFDQPEGTAPRAAETHPSDAAAPELTPAPALPAAASAADNDKQWELIGDWIRLRLRMDPTRPTVHEATVVGNVRLAQRAPLLDDTSLLITGDMLQLRTDLLDRSTVDVNGVPARVHAQGMLWEGSNLHLSQRENRLWAEGPGRMKLPTRALTVAPAALPLTAPAGPSAPNTPVWISWQGGMDFDGQHVRFVREVAVRGIYSSDNGDRLHTLATGEQLHATFNRYVALERPRRSSDLDVAELRFLGDVLTENQTFNAQDVITSRDRILMRDMTLDRRTGQFHAVGPGWIVSTRYDAADVSRSLPGTAAGRASHDTWTRTGTSRLVYLRVDYQNEIEGNIDKREAVFQHHVRAVYGPVESWDQTLDPDQRGGLGPQGIVMTCQRLFVTETGEGSQRGVELSAVGDTLVEGSTFTAQAQRLAFIQVKDQLVLDGENGLAQLQQQQRQGDKPTTFSARQIKYWISTGQVEVFGATQLDYTHIGQPDVPKARLR